ncbi:hypothetical protein [Microbulbifer spongiae]|uniref:Morphogenetic protein n=1 Tax=Microbulbifer spongiae TaxID=2944933 RepID=A0ABY9EFG9_9GAMM|nr:hypothetical protein [Microbulbifer sp. MI-G]WKD51699.1 hypothetical protein M8T91_18480 [Microbulbifer sp. MI-G]
MSEIAKERPIIFNGPMVRAILEGRKTQTRRIIKPQPFNGASSESAIKQIGGLRDEQTLSQVMTSAWQAGFVDTTCPCGEEGDRLWVRETHHLSHHNAITYRADYNHNPFDEEECGEDCSMVGEKWRPSIHMPRWASRIDLEITRIGVERLQDISEEDAKAEGMVSPYKDKYTHFLEFCDTWKEIYGANSWDANPWVWVIEFKRVETTQ